MEGIKASVIETEKMEAGSGFVTRAEVEEMIADRLGSIRVYITEADITRAQENARTLSANAEF